MVHHFRNSSVLSLLNALLALFQCACVFSFSILVQFFQVDCDFSSHDVHQKDKLPSFAKRVKRTRKTVTLETKMLVIRKMEAGEKRANFA